MYLENFTFLAAETARSLIYLEKFKEQSIEFGSILIIKNPDKKFKLADLNKKIGAIQKNLGLAEQKGFHEDILSLSKKVGLQKNSTKKGANYTVLIPFICQINMWKMLLSCIV